VQIVTLHKSKGLEYPLVFLPYVGIGGKPPHHGGRVVVHGDDGRVLQDRDRLAETLATSRPAWLSRSVYSAAVTRR